MNKRKWTEAEQQRLKDMVKNGLSYSQIAETLDRSVASSYLMSAKLKLKRLQNVNVDFFNNGTEESYYVLGYWLADGCIMQKSGGYYFSIVSKDKNHLEKIVEVMGVKTKLYNNSNDTYELRVGNKNLVENLMRLGGCSRKTKTITINDLSFNQKYFYALLRGYFDGDGGFQFQDYTKRDGTKSVSAIKFTGSPQLIESLSQYIGFGVLSKDNRKSNCSYLSFYGNKMREILNFMYNNSKIHLDRKFKIYEMMNQQLMNNRKEVYHAIFQS